MTIKSEFIRSLFIKITNNNTKLLDFGCGKCRRSQHR